MMNYEEAIKLTKDCVNRAELCNAWIQESEDGMMHVLISNSSIIAILDFNTDVLINVNGVIYPSTMRHYKEFLVQYGLFDAVHHICERENLSSLLEFRNRIEQIDLKNKTYKVS